MAKVSQKIVSPQVSRTPRPLALLGRFLTDCIRDRQMVIGWPILLNYNRLGSGPAPDLPLTLTLCRSISKRKLPLKVKIIGWLLLWSRFLTRHMRSRWSPRKSATCTLCSRRGRTAPTFSSNALLIRRHGDRRVSLAWTLGQRSLFGTPFDTAHTAMKPRDKNSLRFFELSGFTKMRLPSRAANPRPWLS